MFTLSVMLCPLTHACFFCLVFLSVPSCKYIFLHPTVKCWNAFRLSLECYSSQSMLFFFVTQLSLSPITVYTQMIHRFVFLVQISVLSFQPKLPLFIWLLILVLANLICLNHSDDLPFVPLPDFAYQWWYHLLGNHIPSFGNIISPSPPISN